MRIRPGAALTSAVAIGFGVITLAGLLVSDDVSVISDLLLQLVVVTIAITVLIGLLNLLTVHLGRIFKTQGGWVYSLVMLISAGLVIVLTILERTDVIEPDVGERAPSAILLESVQVSIESALGGLVFFALVYGAARLMRRRVTWWGILFTAVLMIVLIGALPVSGLSRLLDVRDWLLEVPVSAGSRGILLGIALGTVVTGARVLIGQDRSYRE